MEIHLALKPLDGSGGISDPGEIVVACGAENGGHFSGVGVGETEDQCGGGAAAAGAVAFQLDLLKLGLPPILELFASSGYGGGFVARSGLVVCNEAVEEPIEVGMRAHQLDQHIQALTGRRTMSEHQLPVPFRAPTD